MTDVFREVVSATGLSTVFADETVRHCCERVGLDPHRLRSEDVPTLLPELEKALRIFLGKAQAPERVKAVASLARASS